MEVVFCTPFIKLFYTAGITFKFNFKSNTESYDYDFIAIPLQIYIHYFLISGSKFRQ